MMDELLEQFLIEGRDLVAQAHRAILALGRDGRDGNALDGLFRAAHTLKGSVALFDMAPAEAMLHEAESRLDAVRRAEATLGPDLLDALVAAMDQTDRWIDAMEARGCLDAGAPAAAAGIIALLAPQAAASPQERARLSPEVPDWVAVLKARPELAGHAARGTGTVFRYTPDAECFFRGDDPLALVSAVPDLVAIAVVPAGDAWPDLSDCEPFHCFAAIEGISGADETAVRATFRLVPDQVTTAPFAGVAAPAETGPEGGAADATTLLRVEAAVLDRLTDQSGELVIAARTLEPLVARAGALDPALAGDLRAAQDAIETVAGGLRRSVAQARLVSLEPSLRRLPRLARETAAALGKQVGFRLSGETTRVDKQIADQIFEPLLHMVRNAIDHGIELPEIRKARAKPAMGEITLSIRQEGEAIRITIADDGAGIDAALMRDAVVGKGLLTREAADALTDADALQVVFLPGFSTAAKVTDISGRGVGMDVVRTSIERLAGTIAIASTAGAGTQVELRLPASAISTPILVVEAGGEYLGIRLDQIAETARIAVTEIQAVGLGKACVLRDAAVPVIDLAEVLGLGVTGGDLARLVVTEIAGSRTAIRVHALAERFDAVIREPSALLGAMPRIGGTAQRADGSVLLILDLAELLS